MKLVLEVLLGVAGPILVVGVTWALMMQTYRRNPADLTRLMIKAFAAKMVFFGAYVAVVLRALPVRPIPFVTAFTGAFIGSYLLQALWLRRLLAEDART